MRVLYEIKYLINNKFDKFYYFTWVGLYGTVILYLNITNLHVYYIVPNILQF